jgi:hypothetical protein
VSVPNVSLVAAELFPSRLMKPPLLVIGVLSAIRFCVV